MSLQSKRAHGEFVAEVEGRLETVSCLPVSPSNAAVIEFGDGAGPPQLPERARKPCTHMAP